MALTIKSVRTASVVVPMKRALGTSARRMDQAPIVLVDLETEEGITGRSYVFCYMAAAIPAVESFLREADAHVRGREVIPRTIASDLAKHFRLLSVRGVVTMALAGLDGACWDALAIDQGAPLVSLLGGRVTPVPAYNSNGLSIQTGFGIRDSGFEMALATEAQALLEGGFTALKVRLGYPTLAEDLAAARAVRKHVGPDIKLMVDYNQALTVHEALMRGQALEEEGLVWIEEPVRHDDYQGSARLARVLTTPIQIGENFDGPHGMADALALEACDLVMPDFGRIGGVTGWMESAHLAQSAGLGMSSHLYPEVSAHLLAATPTCQWLEYVDWAAPVLKEPIEIRDGHAIIPDRPGVGMEWDLDAVERYRVR